jgi:predicted alpha/beta hydrolase family esterase
MPDRTFLIVHGLHGSGPEHWQSWLAERLRAAVEDVRYPTLPDFDEPSLGSWLSALRSQLSDVPAGKELVVACHSLGSILWLHHAASADTGARRPARLLLNAPPGSRAAEEEPVLTRFLPPPLDAQGLHRSADEVRIVIGTEDPYDPDAEARRYARALGVPLDVIEGGGHLNADSGFGPWPAVERWCLAGAAPITRD